MERERQPHPNSRTIGALTPMVWRPFRWDKAALLRGLHLFAVLCALWSPPFKAYGGTVPSSQRAAEAMARIQPKLSKALADQGLDWGAPIFIRIFKEPGELELWVKTRDNVFKHFKTYDICRFSGGLGPKTKQGDNQSPEGFYYVTPNQMNPWSQYHLSFNLGYPNAYDRLHGRTGSALMVHGNCVSIGCYAMTDAYVDEIYSLAAAALEGNQGFFRVHIFPFRLEPEALAKYQDHPWYDFWRNLQQGYRYFERNHIPPNVTAAKGQYVFNVQP